MNLASCPGFGLHPGLAPVKKRLQTSKGRLLFQILRNKIFNIFLIIALIDVFFSAARFRAFLIRSSSILNVILAMSDSYYIINI
jgi:hypothetical protein